MSKHTSAVGAAMGGILSTSVMATIPAPFMPFHSCLPKTSLSRKAGWWAALALLLLRWL